MARWEPLISERCFAPWLLAVPGNDEQARARPITREQIAKLETLWKTRPRGRLEDIDAPGAVEEELAPVQLRVSWAPLGHRHRLSVSDTHLIGTMPCPIGLDYCCFVIFCLAIFLFSLFLSLSLSLSLALPPARSTRTRHNIRR